MPIRRLPPLQSLRAFEAAARRGSFKAAAEELAVTPGAISQRIRGLEEELGVKLFDRAVRSVTMSEAGRALHPPLSDAFRKIQDAIDAVRPEQAKLKVAAFDPVIRKWLLPRFHRFAERYPDLTVAIEGGHEFRELEPGEIFVRFSDQPGAEDVFHQTLCAEYVLPLAAPSLVERLALRTPADIKRAPLLHYETDQDETPAPGWPAWFSRVGLDPAQARRGMRFDWRSADHAIEAAINGAGVVLGRWFLAREDLNAGRLVAPFGPAIAMEASYRVVCRRGEETRSSTAAFINWAIEETAAASNAAAKLV